MIAMGLVRLVLEYTTFSAKSRGLGQAGPGPSREWWLWLGPDIKKAKAASGRAKAGAFRPSRARQITTDNNISLQVDSEPLFSSVSRWSPETMVQEITHYHRVMRSNFWCK